MRLQLYPQSLPRDPWERDSPRSHTIPLVLPSINTITFAEGSYETRSRREEESMPSHRRRRTTKRSSVTPFRPKGWGGTAPISSLLLLDDGNASTRRRASSQPNAFGRPLSQHCQPRAMLPIIPTSIFEIIPVRAARRFNKTSSTSPTPRLPLPLRRDPSSLQCAHDRYQAAQIGQSTILPRFLLK